MDNKVNPGAPEPPKEANMQNIVNPKPGPTFTTSAEIRIDQSMRMFLQGKRAYDKGEYDKAIDSLKSAIEYLKPGELSNQESAVFYSYLGLAMQKKGWDGYAKAQFQKALSLNPNDSIALENMGSGVKTDTKKTEEQPANDRSFIKKIKSIFSK